MKGAGILSGSLAGISRTASPAAPGDQVTKDILNNSLSYINANHADAVRFITDDIVFALSSSAVKDIEGYTAVTYSEGCWVVSIGHAIVPHYSWGITPQLSDAINSL